MSLRRDEEGFTLVELLVVILIMSILAAIAMPLYLAQKNKGREADVRATLRNSANAAETYGTDNNGDYSALDGDNGSALAGWGFTASSNVSIAVAALADRYCVTATHADLPADHAWRIATYNSSDGFPSPNDADAC